MEKLNFKEEEKWLLKLMRKEFDSKGIIHTLDFLNEYTTNKLDIVVNGGSEQIATLFRNENINKQDKQKKISKFVAALMFIKKLEDKELIYSIDEEDYTPLFGILKCVSKEPIDDEYVRYNFEGDCYIEYNTRTYMFGNGHPGFFEPDPAKKSHKITELLKKNHHCILTPKLIDYIENGFKTDEEKSVTSNMNISRWSLFLAFVTSIASIGFGAYSTFFGEQKVDPAQLQELRQSIESLKSVTVENEKISVDAKVDTVTVKQAVKPVTNRNKNRNVTITITEDQFQQLRQSIESTKPGEVEKPNK